MTESERYSLPWHGNLYQGERASEKRGLAFGHPTNSAVIGGQPDRGPDLPRGVPEEMAIQNVRPMPTASEAEALALAWRILDAAPNPSHIRELALALVRALEGWGAVGRDVG
jgi:hypothetical protein